MTYQCKMSKFEIKKLENKKKKKSKKQSAKNSTKPNNKKEDNISRFTNAYTHGIRAIDNLDRTGVNYKAAMAEIKNNTIKKKKSHYIWYIFPQPPYEPKSGNSKISKTSKFFYISDAETKLFLEDRFLSKSLDEVLASLETKNLELQRKEDALLELEAELNRKSKLLEEREKRVNELEELIKRKDAAVEALRNKVAAALKGFEDKGLTVVEKNGKIYVSLEAKLLFASGSTKVESEGQRALIDLAYVLQEEKDIEIIVEGHTDADKINSSVHPKNNWELSVLRATSVVQIMLANSSMDPTQLTAAGRSEFIPVDPDDKAKNRRIEIIISPNLNELFEIISK